MIVEKQKEEENKVTYIVKLDNDKFVLNIYTKNIYDSIKDFSVDKIKEVRNYKYGDYLTIDGKIVIPELLGNVGEFNYKRYLNSKGIIASMNAYDVDYVDNIGNKAINLIYKLKEYISSRIDNNLQDRESELLKGMLYGDNENLDEEIKEDFQNIGISHITAVSGSNLSIFVVIFTIILNKTKLNKYVYVFIQILLISIFCLISNLELSVLRAGIMMIISIVYRIKNKRISIEKALLLTLFIFLCVNPYRIFNTGMLLSFLATISISVFYHKIYNFFESKIYWNIHQKIVQKVLLKISVIVSITISANILITPITISTFNTFSTIFIVSNLFVSTLAAFINILGIISIIIPKIPFVFDLLWNVLNISLKLLINISELLNEITLNINIREIPFIIILIYYLYIFLIYLSYKLKGDKKLLRLKLAAAKRNLICIFIILISIWHIYVKAFNNYIYYFNVGQGEMAIIKKNDIVIMADSGSITNDTSYIFEGFSKKEGIEKIDIIIISHFHSDHVNGIKKIIQNYEVDYIMYAYPYDVKNKEYLDFLEYISKSKVKQMIVKSGDSVNIGEICIDVVFPDSKYIRISSEMDENENANSLVVNIKVNSNNYLLLGDSIKESEKYILENLNKINVSKVQNIKIGHHGSNTSTSESLITSLMPDYAVISAKKKVYNHPSKEVIDILDRYEIKTYITEKDGGIKFVGI